MSINLNLSMGSAIERFHKTLDKPAPIGGIVVRDGVANDNNAFILNKLLSEAKNRGLLVIDATRDNALANIGVDGLARRKADIIIHKDMLKEDIERALQKAENIAFDK